MCRLRIYSIKPSPWSSLRDPWATSTRRHSPPVVDIVRAKLGRKQYPHTIDAPMQITFHEGKDKQHRLNNSWLRDRMVGNWGCPHCGKVHEFCRAPVYCTQCLSKNLQYQEVVFYHPTGAQGSLDAIIDVGKPLLRLVEFKILGTKDWEPLKAPLGEHRMRSKLYLEIIKDSNHPQKHLIDLTRIHVLYCLRGYGRLDPVKKRISPFKEYVIQEDPDGVAEYFRMAMAVTASKNADWHLFPEGICATIMDKRCHSCSVQKECFSGHYPATYLWK